MFDGSSEQFHQFIASSTTAAAAASLPISLPFPLHAFDHPYAPTRESCRDPWSNDELLSLLKLRSSMEIWFPDFTWEHVSRKLGELGFKRSAEQCKEKFEEESRNFNTSKSYRMMSELHDLCHGGDDQDPENPKKVEENKEEEIAVAPQQVVEKKRKRRDKLETFKGFCEAVVKKMMAKQEQLHNKLIQDILKRDQEKIARDEAWKNQEIERFTTQIQTRSKDHKSAAQRQAAIIEFLTHFTSHNNDNKQEEEEAEEEEEELNNKSNSNSSTTIPPSLPPPPSSPSADPPPPSDVGKRWPRDEVVALINLRCKMSGEQENNNNNNSKEGSTKGPLWERISAGMKEIGYKRSAKRCKEKWENINKYFRKTKDSTKKRSLNSRTCPYFHHLSSLYGDGTIIAPTAAPAPAPVVDLGGERAAVDVDVDVDGVF